MRKSQKFYTLCLFNVMFTKEKYYFSSRRPSGQREIQNKNFIVSTTLIVVKFILI